MALVTRITRLFRADFHAVLDQLEEPEQVLRQAVRDMEDELDATEQRIAALAHEQEHLTGRIGEVDAALTDAEAELDLCFRSGRDDLARKMIRRKIETERLRKRLVANRSAIDQQLDDDRRQFDDNSAALHGLRQKAELFSRRNPQPGRRYGDDDGAEWTARQMTVSDEEVEIAYLREKDLRSAS